MPVKVRLQRHGRKGYAYYHIVVADSRAPRDGRFIERLGSYNPNTNPATVDVNFDRALYWVQTGAQPTDTARNLLSSVGVYMKKHLLEGVKKGAFDLTEAEKRFEAWMSEKDNKLEGKKTKLAEDKDREIKERLEEEKAYNKKRQEEIQKRLEEEAKAKEEKEITEETTTTEETTEEEPGVEEEKSAEEQEETSKE